MNDRVQKERLGTSRLNHVFLKIYPYDPTSKFQAISSDLTFMQSKIKIHKTDFWQTKTISVKTAFFWKKFASNVRSKIVQNLYRFVGSYALHKDP